MKLALTAIAAAAVLPLLASAHFTLDYPPTRGFDEDIESRALPFCHVFFGACRADCPTPSPTQSSAAASRPPRRPARPSLCRARRPSRLGRTTPRPTSPSSSRSTATRRALPTSTRHRRGRATARSSRSGRSRARAMCVPRAPARLSSDPADPLTPCTVLLHGRRRLSRPVGPLERHRRDSAVRQPLCSPRCALPGS